MLENEEFTHEPESGALINRRNKYIDISKGNQDVPSTDIVRLERKIGALERRIIELENIIMKLQKQGGNKRGRTSAKT